MYNRYIPQSDGTYRRNRIQDSPARAAAVQQAPPTPPPVPPAQTPCPETPPPRPPLQNPAFRPCPVRPCPRKQEADNGVTGFLRQLLPAHFDTVDLLVILLLLLMSGDCREDQNSALLTLALYLFM